MDILNIMRVAALAFFVLSSQANASQDATSQSDAAANGTYEQARELLHAWSGQPDNLIQAKAILDQLLLKNPQDYKAITEMAYYTMQSGYFHSKTTPQGFAVPVYAPGTLEHAEGFVAESIEINPNFAESYLLLGEIRAGQSQFDAAREALTKAESLDPQDPWIQLGWAGVLNMSGDSQAAFDRYTRITKSGTTDQVVLATAYMFLNKHYILQKDFPNVIASYQEILKLEPTNAWVRENYAEFLLNEIGDVDEATKYVSEALHIIDFGVGERTLAFCLYRKWAEIVSDPKGNNAGAQQYYDAAYKIFPLLNSVMANQGSYLKGKLLVQALMAKGISIDAPMDAGTGGLGTALSIASSQDRADAVRSLLSMGANPNNRTSDGWTALLGAAYLGHTDVAMALLKGGADPRQTFKDKDAVAMANSRGNTELASKIQAYMQNGR